MKRAALAIGLLLAAIEIAAACSEQVPLAPLNSKCEFDEQCAKGLSCKCIRRRNPDDEGPDEILEPGRCVNPLSYTCPRDGGVADTAFDAPPPIDAEPDTAIEDAADAAADGG
jgi:hypothetical protein